MTTAAAANNDGAVQALHIVDPTEVLNALHIVDPTEVLNALHDVDDPELPIDIVDLGLVDAIDVSADTIRVRLLPTFSGCPALGQIAARARTRLQQLTPGTVEIAWSRAGQWTPDRIAPGARESLAHYGVGCSAASAPLPACPSCASQRTERVSRFGSSLCRSSFRCTACGNRFEALKPPGLTPSAGALGVPSATRSGLPASAPGRRAAVANASAPALPNPVAFNSSAIDLTRVLTLA